MTLRSKASLANGLLIGGLTQGRKALCSIVMVLLRQIAQMGKTGHWVQLELDLLI